MLTARLIGTHIHLVDTQRTASDLVVLKRNRHVPAKLRVIHLVWVMPLCHAPRMRPAVIAATRIPRTHTAIRPCVDGVQHLRHGVQELELHIVGLVQGHDVTHHMVAHVGEVALEILADARHRLPVLLALALVTRVGNLPLVIVSDVRPLQQELMPVSRAAHSNRRNNRAVHLHARQMLLTPMPQACVVHNAACRVNDF